MEIVFVKTIHFTRLIKTGDRLREFNFIRFGRSMQEQFDVDVVDNRGNRVMFRMLKDDDRWRLVKSAQLPDWVLATEPALHEVIEEELSMR